MRRAHPGRLSAAALLLTLVACACEGGDKPDPARPGPKAEAARPVIARLHELQGPVELERAGERRPATEEALYGNDAIETGPLAQAKLTFGDGRVLELGPLARLRVGEDSSGLVLELERGLVISRVSASGVPGVQRPEVEMRILTPFGLTRVAAGQSEVSYQVGTGEVTVAVLIGQVELMGTDGQSTRAGPGEILRLEQGRVQILSRAGEPDRATPVPFLLEATLVAKGGGELRRAGSAKWTPVGRKPLQVAEGDSVRVRKGRASLGLPGGTSLNLLDGSELVFLEGRSVDGVEQAQVDLKKGQVELDLARGRRSRLLAGGVLLESEDGGYFLLVRTKDGYEVVALTGQALVRQGEVSERISAGQVARLAAGGGAQVRAAIQPELVLPTRAGLRVFHPGLPQAALSWRGSSGKYRVRVAADPKFERLLLEGTVYEPKMAVPIPRRGLLYWEVVGEDGEPQSGNALFGPEPTLKELDRARNEVPEGPEKTTIFYQDRPPSVTFTYAAQEGVARYQVAVYRADALDRPVAERTVQRTAAPLEAGILGEGSYVWSVTPLGAEGEPLKGGRMNKLDLVYDNSVPNLVIRAPANGSPAAKGTRTHGVAPVGSKLFVNGRPAELDDKSRFDTEASPKGVPPVVIYRLSRGSGPDAFYVRTLRSQR